LEEAVRLGSTRRREEEAWPQRLRSAETDIPTCHATCNSAGFVTASLGRTILLTVLWIYLPMLLAAPTDVVALNYFFDTLLFCGAILLLANAIDKETACGADLMRIKTRTDSGKTNISN
jgi:hypothetical protein